jgi:hypothetical protein
MRTIFGGNCELIEIARPPHHRLMLATAGSGTPVASSPVTSRAALAHCWRGGDVGESTIRHGTAREKGVGRLWRVSDVLASRDVTSRGRSGRAGAAVACFTSEWSDGEFERALGEWVCRRRAKWGWSTGSYTDPREPGEYPALVRFGAAAGVHADYGNRELAAWQSSTRC